MKYKLLVIALLPFSVFASNTITFLGEVSDATCDITVDGTKGDISVQLPTVLAKDLASKGATTGETPFSFAVSGCSAVTQTSVGIRLIPTSTTNSGNLTNISGATTASENVSVQVLDNATGTPVAIDFTKGEYSSALKTFPTADNSVQFPFVARYYADDVAKVGKVESKLQYALTYK